jgi:hypothetical protein
MVLSLIAISITSGNVLAIFPVNTLFWLGVSATIVTVSVPKRAEAVSPVRNTNDELPAGRWDKAPLGQH